MMKDKKKERMRDMIQKEGMTPKRRDTKIKESQIRQEGKDHAVQGIKDTQEISPKDMKATNTDNTLLEKNMEDNEDTEEEAEVEIKALIEADMFEDKIKERDQDKETKGVGQESKDKGDHKGKDSIADKDNHLEKDTMREGRMEDTRDRGMKESK